MLPASQDDDDGYDCSRFDISGCVPAGGDVLNDCLQGLIDEQANIAVYQAGRYRLICSDFRHHIVDHFSTYDDGYIPEEDAYNFLDCTSRALSNGVDTNSSAGFEALKTSNTSGTTGTVVYRFDPLATLPGSLHSVYTAYTSGDGKDWGGCVRDAI